MNKTLLATLAAAVLLSGCATLYSTHREWRLPGGFGNYVMSAQMSVGFLTRQVTISVNDRELLSGQSYWWEDRIEMAGVIDRLPIAAVCMQTSKTCDVSIAGFRAVTLNF